MIMCCATARWEVGRRICGPGLRNWAAAEPSWVIPEVQAGVLPGDLNRRSTAARRR
jgi:hypothetical protein